MSDDGFRLTPEFAEKVAVPPTDTLRIEELIGWTRLDYSSLWAAPDKTMRLHATADDLIAWLDTAVGSPDRWDLLRDNGWYVWFPFDDADDERETPRHLKAFDALAAAVRVYAFRVWY